MATRVQRRTLQVTSGVAEAFYRLYADGNCVAWLDSFGERGTQASVLADGELVELRPGDELEHLRDVWQRIATGETEEFDAIPLGLLGWLAYDIAEHTLGVAGVSSGASSRVMVVRRALEVDHVTGAVTAWALDEDEAFDTWCAALEETLVAPAIVPDIRPPASTEATWRDTPDQYRELISRALDAIREGEVYQLCLTTELTIPTELSDVELHRLLREASPTHHQGLLRLGDVSLISSSPETFLSLDGNRLATTRPIKGTRPRGLDEESDRRLAAELVDSEKERAENLMIVDLMRNDLQKVCETGSVQVTGLFDVETYASVHQLVSTVTGRLHEGTDGVDLLRACFPAGSMTGAPKHRAVTLLRDFESGPRGIYSGAWGWWRVDGSMEWAMTIRSVVWSPGTVTVGVGGGITWSSDPAQEVAEVGHKARRILEALHASSAQYS